MKALVLYNPVAGRIPVEWFIDNAAKALKSLGWSVEVQATKSGAHATEAARQAAGMYDVVFAVGGDGTVGQVASGLAGSETAMGILPAGTMNVFALELGLHPFSWAKPWAMEENIRLLAHAGIHPVDMGCCNGNHFLLWSGIGLDAVTVQQMEPRPRWDKFITVPHYAAQAVISASTWRGVNLRCRVNGQEVEDKYIMAIVSNVRKYMGGIVTLSPNACLNDGEMDLWLFPGEDLGDILRHFVGLATQSHVNDPNVRRFGFQNLEIESSEPFSLHLDGDPIAPTKTVRIEVEQGSLRLLVPNKALYMLKNGGNQISKINLQHQSRVNP